MSTPCTPTALPAAPTVCEQVRDLMGAIHARTVGKGAVTRVAFGSGASRSDVTYSDVPIEQLRLSLKNLVMSGAASNCADYPAAAALVGMPQRMGSIGLNPSCQPRGCC